MITTSNFHSFTKNHFKFLYFYLKSLTLSFLTEYFLIHLKPKFKTLPLEIGSGPKRRLHFNTLDLYLNTDYPYDLSFGLPFPDNSIPYIYSEHVLEHFSYSELLTIFSECYRTLIPGGTFSISVPNVSNLFQYHQNTDFLSQVKFSVPQIFNNNLDIINYMVYLNGQHKYCFDLKNIITFLSNAGFSKISERCYDPNYDSPNRKDESLFFIAFK
jgi:predicted SAM-dependent methyltransferase